MNFNFTFKNILLIFFSTLLATTINVPGDYPTIQGALDVAQDGDIVLVSSGTYTENLLMEKEVTLLSVNGAGSTIIDGSGQTQGVLMASTITIRPESNSPTIPQNIEIDGFEIKGGTGNEMTQITPTGSSVTKRVGAGIMAYNTSPKISNNDIKNNGNAQTSNGGGIVAIDSSEDWSFNDREYEINPELPPATDNLDISNNTFYQNNATNGHTLSVYGFEELTTNLSNSTFDSYSSTYQGVSEYWVEGYLTEFDYEGSQGTESIYTDVWVNPEEGSDQFHTSGSIEDPFKTINFALSMIYPTEDNPIMIHLIAGTFSPSTNNESFPIIITSNISLTGVGEEITILDAESNEENPVRVITIEQSINNSISDMTITGGNTAYPHDYGGHGGGIRVSFPFGGPPPVSIDSHPTLSNLTIRGNSSSHGGGGISMSGGYSGALTNITVSGNYALAGGGIYMYNASPNMHQIIITQNIASSAGGLHIQNSSPIITDMLISENIAETIVGGVRIGGTGDNHNTTLTNVDIIGNMSNPTGGQNSWAGGIDISSPAELTNVLISGNSAYSGGGLHIRGYDFSVLSIILNNVTISENIAEGAGGGVFMLDTDQSVQFSNVTISGNECGGYDGGGMYLNNSNPWLTNMTISNNIGEGMYLYNSSPYLENIIIKDNEANRGAGIYISDNNPPVTGRRLLITDNIAGSAGGGIYLSPNAEISLEHSTISNNIFTYSSGNGAGIYTDGGNVNLVNSIVYHNKRGMNNNWTSECSDYWDESGCIETVYWDGFNDINFCQWVLNPETNMEECDDLIDPNIYGYSEDLLSEYNISYSNIEGYSVPEGEGNISQNPEFTDLENGIYSLSGGSPCIDTGTADIDGDGQPDITDYVGSSPDMGAIEYTPSGLSGDINGDGSINIQDVVLLVYIVLGYSETIPSADINGDGTINVIDVVTLVSYILS